ncbi:hypothetical protein Efla_002012 [Eimeria flavescens]
MGNPRNLRRASSEDEDEGDVFDDKSEISSGSDEEEATHRGEAPAGSNDSLQGAEASSVSDNPAVTKTVAQSRDAPAASSGEEVNIETPDDVPEESHPRTRPHAGPRPRGGSTREDGSRRRVKTTWQLMQEDPSFVPRETRYFLHDDRRDGDEEEADDAEVADNSQPDFSVPRSTQMRVGPAKKLWTPNEDKGVWKHDMWEKLQKEEAECKTTARSWNKGRPGRRGGYNGYDRGGYEENWFPRGHRGARGEADFSKGDALKHGHAASLCFLFAGFAAARATATNPGAGVGGLGAERGAMPGCPVGNTLLVRARRTKRRSLRCHLASCPQVD